MNNLLLYNHMLEAMNIVASIIIVCFIIRVLVLWYDSLPLPARLLLVAGAGFAYLTIASVWDGSYNTGTTQTGMNVSFSAFALVMLWKWRRLSPNPIIIARNRAKDRPSAPDRPTA